MHSSELDIERFKGRSYKCVATCDFQLRGILTSVDSDGPVEPPFKLRN